MQPNDNYTPGYTKNASDSMAQRSAQTHAAFLLPHLLDETRLLDCGCGPGSVTCDFARIIPSGRITGIDREATQIERARSYAASHRLTNANFEVGSIYDLPFPDSSFDVVFAHAVFEHLSSPSAALAEVSRVLAPGGLAALRSPDWGGFIVAPDTPGLQSALHRYIDTSIHRYIDIQTANGGDIHVGRKFPGLLRGTDWPLDIAVQQARMDMVKLLLANGAKIHGKELARAAFAGNQDESLAMVTALLQAGADANSSYNGFTALIWASYNGNENSVNLLLAKPGLKLDETDPDGHTALMTAAERGQSAA